jgi:hypothetical protein
MATVEQDIAVAGPAVTQAPSRRMRHGALAAALVLAALCTTITALATTRTSPTFDEIVLMAGGARGYATGQWDIAPEHPPLMQYLYGLPIHLSQPSYPESSIASERGGDFSFRYTYARELLWTTGNDPERIAFLGRLPGALLAGVLVLAAFAFARRFGNAAGVFAAGLVAFLPDVLAHGGVAYNDLPLALAWLLAVWALDAAVRRPTLRAGALAGLAIAFALGIKFSAVLLVPLALVFVAAEALVQGRDPKWWRSVGIAVVAGMLAGYAGLVGVYRGEFSLSEFFYGLDYTFSHVNNGHSAPGFLMGKLSADGWWYYFPVAFLFKTPAALHILLLVGIAGLARAVGLIQRTGVGSGSGANGGERALKALAGAKLRAPVLGALVFGAALVTSNLNIGFRYALPVLPLVGIIAAAGIGLIWRDGSRVLRGGLAVLAIWYAASTLAFYPHFLAYTSEYGAGADKGHMVLADSSLDWGQGLLDLRDWMEARDVDRIYLSYFGSAVPAGYGIRYVPLLSFYPLPPYGPPPETPPKYAVIAATNLNGVYMTGDPFAQFRAMEPDTIIAHTLLVYRVNEPGD